MTPRERVLAVLNRQPVDRLPVDLWHTPEVGAALRAHTGAPDDLACYEALGLDKVVWVFPDYRTDDGALVGSLTTGEDGAARTVWGTRLRTVASGAGHYDEFADRPLAGYETAADLDRYPYWPDPGRFDYAAAAAKARRAARTFAVIGPWVSLFEVYCQLRGLEQAMLDLVDHPAFVDAALDRIEAIQTEMMRRYVEHAGDALDLVFVSDDIAGQQNLLLSPRMWRRFLQPRLVRWCELVHGYGLKVFYHTDGAAAALVGPLIDCGVDVLNPIQHACPGMELAPLKARFGERVLFHGGVDNQSVLPFGTPADVRAETQRCLDTLGAGRAGYICCSCHNVQAGTPVQNILAMIETVRGS